MKLGAKGLLLIQGRNHKKHHELDRLARHRANKYFLEKPSQGLVSQKQALLWLLLQLNKTIIARCATLTRWLATEVARALRGSLQLKLASPLWVSPSSLKQYQPSI